MVPQPTFEADRLRLVADLEHWHFWFVGRRALVDRLIAVGELAPGASVLDAGCGTGALAADLATRGYRVLAFDLRPEGPRRFPDASRLVLPAQANVTALPLSDDSVDAVIATDVLEHTDDGQALREVHRVLRPGGVLIATVPALPRLWSSRDEDAGHHRRYTRRRLREAIARAGLDPVDVRSYQCLLLPLLVATRLAGRRWPGSQRMEERPAGWINRVLAAVNRFEVAVSDRVRWPWGTSLAVLARAPMGNP